MERKGLMMNEVKDFSLFVIVVMEPTVLNHYLIKNNQHLKA